MYGFPKGGTGWHASRMLVGCPDTLGAGMLPALVPYRQHNYHFVRNSTSRRRSTATVERTHSGVGIPPGRPRYAPFGCAGQSAIATPERPPAELDAGPPDVHRIERVTPPPGARRSLGPVVRPRQTPGSRRWQSTTATSSPSIPIRTFRPNSSDTSSSVPRRGTSARGTAPCSMIVPTPSYRRPLAR